MAGKKAPDFEIALRELETIVERMESNDLSLEEMLKDYERGMALSGICQKSLDEAELRVEKLTKTVDGFKSEPMNV